MKTILFILVGFVFAAWMFLMVMWWLWRIEKK